MRRGRRGRRRRRASATASSIHHHAPCGECRRCRARSRDAVRPVPRDRARPRRLRRAGAPRPASSSAELLALGGARPGRGDVRRAARLRPARAAIAPACSRATRCSSSAPAPTGCSQSRPRTLRGVEAVWVREPPRAAAAAPSPGAPPPTPTSPSTSRSCTTASGDAIAGAAARARAGRDAVPVRDDRPGTPLGLDAEQLFLRELRVLLELVGGPGGHARGAASSSPAAGSTSSRW